MTAPSVTVTVLTYNGDKYLDDLLSAVESQRYAGDVDLLVIDSGSSDDTLKVIASHPNVRLHTIPNSEFGHGRTRNLAASLARGNIVVYLTHDAVPASDGWLDAIVAPFVDDPRVAAVVGKQVARGHAAPAVKFDIARTFAALGPDVVATVYEGDWRGLPTAQSEAATFYSDANSAARRSVLLETVPFRDVAYAEDQWFARDILDAGLRKAYAPAAAVIHSNDTTLRTFGARVRDDLAGLRSSRPEAARYSGVGALARWVKWTLVESALIVRDADYPPARKAAWLAINPWYLAVKWRELARR